MKDKEHQSVGGEYEEEKKGYWQRKQKGMKKEPFWNNSSGLSQLQGR